MPDMLSVAAATPTLLHRIGAVLPLHLQLLHAARAGDAKALYPWGAADPGYRARLVQLLEGGGLGEVIPLRAGANAVSPWGGSRARTCVPHPWSRPWMHKARCWPS